MRRDAQPRNPGASAWDETADANHLWFSVSKTLPATVLIVMEAQGKLDFGDPVERHLPEMRGTAWEGIVVRDVLDMASGLDVEETPGRMGDPDHVVHRFFRTALGGEAHSRVAVNDGSFPVLSARSGPPEARGARPAPPRTAGGGRDGGANA